MDWNAKADALAVEKQLPNAPNARGQAMLHIAMFEALNAIERRYAPYRLNLSADRTASREAAAAAAAYDVLLALHPDKKADLDAALGRVPCRDSRERGEVEGHRARQTGCRRDHRLARQ